MSNELLSDELREIILGKYDNEEVNYATYLAPCYGMSWDAKSGSWIVRVDNKRVMDIGRDDVPEAFDLRSLEFLNHMLSIMRTDGIEGLKSHLAELKCAE